MMNDLYQDAYEKLSTLQWLLQRYRAENFPKRGPLMDQTRGQGRILAVLKMQSDITTKDLAYILGIRQQSLNELIKKLENAGYVERVPSEKDRRVLFVRLTEKGKSFQTEEHDYSELFDGFGEKELEQFAVYLDRMITALHSKYGDSDERVYEWAERFRSRMSEEEFEQMMSMRRGMTGGFGFDREEDYEMFGRDGRGFGFRRDGKMPENMPGAERFDPDYDGPMPEGRMGFPFGRKKKKDDDKESDGREE